MRYANPAYLKAALDKVQKEVISVEKIVNELQELKAKGLLKDPQEESYMSQLRTKWMEDEAEEFRTAKFVDPEETKRENEYFENLDDAYSAEHTKEDEIANLLAWIKQNEIDQKAHGAVVLGGDHVYPLPVELF